MKFLVFLFSLSLISSQADDGLTLVSIGKAELTKEVIKITGHTKDSISLKKKLLSKKFTELIKNDFSFYSKKFSILDINMTSSSGLTNPIYSALRIKGVSYYFQISFKNDGSSISYSVSSYNVADQTELYKGNGRFTKLTYRKVAHSIADQIYKKITGKNKSVFTSKFIFVSDRSSRRGKPVKELYSMDFDGGNKKQLTYHGGTVISPSLSIDGNQILYSLIRKGRSKRRNINLRLLNIKTKKDRLISSRRGINSGAIFLPGEQSIALTLSHSGNAELYEMNLNTRKLKRLTKHFSPDVDPSISVDGKLMTFLSGRAGKAMIYTLDPSGLEKSVKRISYVGKFNATPRFSPDGKQIAFSSWLDTRFDIFRIDANGDNLSRLTKDFGSNEDPSYSNDGEFIAFSSLRVISKRKADQNIYIMDRDGEVLGSLTKKFGNCITPRWSK